MIQTMEGEGIEDTYEIARFEDLHAAACKSDVIFYRTRLILKFIGQQSNRWCLNLISLFLTTYVSKFDFFKCIMEILGRFG